MLRYEGFNGDPDISRRINKNTIFMLITFKPDPEWDQIVCQFLHEGNLLNFYMAFDIFNFIEEVS